MEVRLIYQKNEDINILCQCCGQKTATFIQGQPLDTPNRRDDSFYCSSCIQTLLGKKEIESLAIMNPGFVFAEGAGE